MRLVNRLFYTLWLTAFVPVMLTLVLVFVVLAEFNDFLESCLKGEG